MFKTTKAEIFVMQEKYIDSVAYLNKLYEMSKTPQSMAWDGVYKMNGGDLILTTCETKILGDKFKFIMLFAFNSNKFAHNRCPSLVKIINLE